MLAGIKTPKMVEHRTKIIFSLNCPEQRVASLVQLHYCDTWKVKQFSLKNNFFVHVSENHPLLFLQFMVEVVVKKSTLLLLN